MKRELVTADLHLTVGEEDAYRHDWVKQLPLLAKRERIDRVIILGDLTEVKDHHGAWLVNAVASHLRCLADVCDVIVMQGNHDYADIGSPFFEFIGGFPNIRWVGKPTVIEDLMFLPHTRDYKRDWATRWSPHDFGGYRWIFAHNTFEGADMGYGQKAEGVPLSMFPEKAHVISGDVHIPQKLGCVTYVGAPYRVNYGDDYWPRVLILENRTMSSHPTKVVHKHLFTINSINDLDTFNLSPGDMIKVDVELPQADYDKWAEIRGAVEGWAERNKFVLKTVRNKSKIRPEAHEAFTVQDDEVLMREYVKRKKANERTLRTGLNLVNET